MVAYFDYLREMFLKVLGDIGTFFYKAFVSPWTDLGNNFNTYNSYMAAHSGATLRQMRCHGKHGGVLHERHHRGSGQHGQVARTH